MKTVTFYLTFAGILLLLAAWLPARTSTVLPVGTQVVLETTTSISSRDAQAGQTVGLRVKYDVKIKGKLVIKAGSAGSAQVVTVEQRKGMGKQGSLSIRPSVMQAVDGQMVTLTGNGSSPAADDTKGAAIGLAVVVSPLFC